MNKPRGAALLNFAFQTNWDTVSLMTKFCFAMVGILLLIFVLAVLTPKAAKIVDKLLGKADPNKNTSPARVKDKDGNEYIVHDIYEGFGSKPSDEEELQEADDNTNTDLKE